MTTPVAVDEFVQLTARYWESNGLSHAGGAILGLLMVCEPAAQTQAQIASALQISAGTVSTQLGLLLRIGLVERVRTPGDRRGRYQLPPNVWTRIFASETERIAGLRALAQAGLMALPASRQDRITSLDAMVRFWEIEWPQLEQRFEDFVRRDEQ
jgi:hypothetical protein